MSPITARIPAVSPVQRPKCSYCSGKIIICVKHDEPDCLLCKKTGQIPYLAYEWHSCQECRATGFELVRHLLCDIRNLNSGPLCEIPDWADRTARPISIAQIERVTCEDCCQAWARAEAAKCGLAQLDTLPPALDQMAQQTLFLRIADLSTSRGRR